MSKEEVVNKDEPVALTQAQYRELNTYIESKARFLSQPGSGHPLNAASQEKLANRLWTVAVKALNRHDPSKAPLMAFVKMAIKLSMYREAQRLYKEQCDRAETPWGDASLDAPLAADSAEGDATLGDFVTEDAETLLRRKRAAHVRQTLSRLPWAEQLALETLMYDDARKDRAAAFLGVSRPTLDAFLKREAIPHFIAHWYRL